MQTTELFSGIQKHFFNFVFIKSQNGISITFHDTENKYKDNMAPLKATTDTRYIFTNIQHPNYRQKFRK